MDSRQQIKDLSQRDIIELFGDITKDNRNIIIPIGFPAAGKSLFISSLMYYSQRDTIKKWSINYENNYPYDQGRISVNSMVNYLDRKKTYPSSLSGTIDIIGATLVTNNASKPNVNFAIIDLAGEDIEKIKVGATKGEFDRKIEGILRGCETGKPIFCLLTPFSPSKGDLIEDTLHFDFLNYLKMDLPILYNNSKFIVLVTQWDKNPNKNQEVEDYLKDKRPNIYNLVTNQSRNKYFADFSVGRLIETYNDENTKEPLIADIERESPEKFWNKIYEVITSKSLVEKPSFFKKLFG